jgi:hypothetical protein
MKQERKSLAENREGIQAVPDPLEIGATSNIVDVRTGLTTLSGTFHIEPEWVLTGTTLEPSF